MKVIAFNGSPRKKWNTATLLEKALEGAASKGAQTELVHLYDLNYKGCLSCFACKTKDGKSYGRCPVKDDLKPIFEKIEKADAIILGSPIYLGRVSGEMASFLERLAFQYMEYNNPPVSHFPGKVRTGFIYTGNVNEEMLKTMNVDKHIEFNENMMIRVFGSSETLISYDTFQFDDYSKYVAPRFDPVHKAKVRQEVFPIDCQKAFDMGASLVN